MTNIDIVTTALKQNKRIHLNYGGHSRTVEVHATGTSKAGKTMIRVWQIGGDSKSKQPVGWKLFNLDGATDLAIADDASEAPRAGYKKGDRAMIDIIAQL